MDGDDGGGVGGGGVGGGGVLSLPVVSCSSPSSRPAPTGSSSGPGAAAAAAASAGRCGAVLVVGKHGRCPWTGLAPRALGGDASDNDGDGGDPGDVRAVLQTEGRAEEVSLLFLRACHLGAELRRPGLCEQVFRPQPWPIREFPAAAAARKRFPAIAVRGKDPDFFFFFFSVCRISLAFCPFPPLVCWFARACSFPRLVCFSRAGLGSLSSVAGAGAAAAAANPSA